MKTLITVTLLVTLAACAQPIDTQAQLDKHEQDRAAHQAYWDWLYNTYDPEYIDDCLFYEELVCEFE